MSGEDEESRASERLGTSQRNHESKGTVTVRAEVGTKCLDMRCALTICWHACFYVVPQMAFSSFIVAMLYCQITAQKSHISEMYVGGTDAPTTQRLKKNVEDLE